MVLFRRFLYANPSVTQRSEITLIVVDRSRVRVTVWCMSVAKTTINIPMREGAESRGTAQGEAWCERDGNSST